MRAVSGLMLLALGLTGNAWASGTLDVWRSDIAAARTLADNDAPAADKEATRLQTMLPAEASPSDRAKLLNLLATIDIYLARTDAAAEHAQQAFDSAKQYDDRVGQAEADFNVALNATNQGRLDNVRSGCRLLDGYG